MTDNTQHDSPVNTSGFGQSEGDTKDEDETEFFSLVIQLDKMHNPQFYTA